MRVLVVTSLIWENLEESQFTHMAVSGGDCDVYQGRGIDIEYNKRLDRQRPCLEGDFNGGSNNIVQSDKSV